MNQKERVVIASILILVLVLVGVDILTDAIEGVVIWHMALEGLVGLAAVFGIFYLLQDSFQTKHRLEKEISDFSEFKKQTDQWKQESKKYIDGLSKAIDQQLTTWKLTVAEKEVAFLLLKGLSLKEIAEIRQTTEKTARVQSMAIYAKSGVSGRSELSAFFLEDLLVPSELSESKN